MAKIIIKTEGPEDGSTPKLVARILLSFKYKIKELLCFRL